MPHFDNFRRLNAQSNGRAQGGQGMRPAPDHLVVAATRLDEGAAWLEEKLGVALAGGGRHLTMGTHNRLLRLGERFYLELIAIDPDQAPPDRCRWFGLDTPELRQRLAGGPQLIHWVAASADIEADAPGAGFAREDVLAMSRGDYRWRITVAADGGLPGDGLVPTLIQWDVPFHPAERLPDSGCCLMKLEAYSRRAPEIRQRLAALGLAAALDLREPAPGEAAEWVAYLKTPRGLVELGGALPD